MSETINPLKFNTIFKEKIWGGDKIQTVLNKDFSPLNNCGETWEISGVKGNISVVSDGEFRGNDLKYLIDKLKGDLVGNKVYQQFGNEFPLLIKFIDANDDLSIQVHPDDELAKSRHNSFGKTEMWYVLDADEGATLISGFNQEMTKDKYLTSFNSGQLDEVLNKENAEAGDTFFIPAGRVHTIGKGLMIAEIQQTSDVTYRIYDFDRTDDSGNKRELHVEEAVEAIDYKKYDDYKSNYSDKTNERILLESCRYFETNKLILTENFLVTLPNIDSFKIYICLEGKATIVTTNSNTVIVKGEVVMIPASTKEFTIEIQEAAQLLETYIPYVITISNMPRLTGKRSSLFSELL
jgi:mannose-6-phosphate isomerase